ASALISATIEGGLPLVAAMDPNSGFLNMWCVGSYNRPKVAAAFTTLRSADANDPVKAKAAWHDINQALADDVPEIFFYFNPAGVAFSPKVAGVDFVFPVPGQGAYLKNVYIKK